VVEKGKADAVIDYIGKYKVVREVGRGATATVFLAEDPDRDEPVAVKLVQFKDNDIGRWAPRIAKLFETEGRVIRRLDHPNIVRVFDHAIERDQAYIAMEFIDGETLEGYTTFEKLLPIHEVVGIVFKCCLALDHAFRQGIVHRDIKPANIMVDKAGNVKITDFGLALDLNRQGHDDSTFIMGVGSPTYMSPEQIKEYPLDQKTDLYSLGVVLYELLTGRLPFTGKTRQQLVYRIINADPPAVSAVNPNVPEAMDKILKRALEKDLYSRYKSGAEMAKDLASVRYQILDDSYTAPDSTHFDSLRNLPFFRRFADVELWETLRISKWRRIDADTVLMREGEEGLGFGIIIEGECEVSLSSKRIGRLGSGEVIGETTYLNPTDPCRTNTVTALTPITYLEVNPAALAIASEDCVDHFRDALMAAVIRRLAAANAQFLASAPPAHLGNKLDRPALDLELVPLDPPRTTGF
jgi:non-specific serine/threonine protein kinase